MRLMPALGLAAALLSAGCTDPYGRPDPVGTALLGAAAGAAVGLAASGAFNQRDHYAYPRNGYGGGYGGGGYNRGGYGGGYGGYRGGWR